MKIKFKTSVYIANIGSYSINSIADIEKNFALKLVSQGLAISVEEPKKEKVVTEPKPKATKRKSKKEGEE